MAYTSEQEARNAYLVALLSYVGVKEGTPLHASILADYNQITPLPRQHRAVSADSWCAIFVNGQGWKLGFRGWPWECSCTLIRDEAKRRGIWREGWSTIPQIGDWLIYNWDGKGAAEHIGAVCAIHGTSVWVVEGNYDNAVKIRRITVGDGDVEGSVALDFSELVQAPADTSAALRPGDSGEAVRKLQFILAMAGYYDGPENGVYGAETTQAVTDFQAANGLDPDGKCGPLTQTVLRGCDYIIREVGKMPEARYQTIEEIPEWGQPTIRKMVELGLLQGTGTGLDLSLDMIRVYVTNDRAGLYNS